MAPSALLVLALAASPTWTVVVTRRVGVDPQRAAELAERLAQALDGAEGAPMGALVPEKSFAAALAAAGAPDPGTCAAAPTCVADLGRQAKVDRVVAVQLLKLGADVALDASVIDTAPGAAPLLLASVTAQLPAGSKRALDGVAARLVAQVPRAPTPPLAPAAEPRASLEPAPAPPAEPSPPTPPPAVAAPPSTTRPLRYVSFGLGAGAVVSVGIAAALGVVALNQANAALNTDPDFLARHAAAVSTARGADVCWGIAGALLVAAVVTFFLSASD